MAGPNRSKILSHEEAESLMRDYDIVVGRRRNYVVETIESHYAHSHYGNDLSVHTKLALEEVSPDMVNSFDTVLRRLSMSLFNMFLMSSSEFDRYSQWLFAVLARCERSIDNSKRTVYEQRTFGYLGEILLNVWVISRETELRVGYLQVVNSEGEPKVRKAIKMLLRKIKGESK